jgi:hypothetical protein
MNPLTLFIGLIAAWTCVFPTHAAFGDRITVSGTEFRAGNDLIWINGANTPWHNWNDFGGKYDRDWWDDHFRQLHEAGMNATRVWISCNGQGAIIIDSTGKVTGCTKAFWNDLDSLFQIAQKRQIYIMATLISFDHFKEGKSEYKDWRKLMSDPQNIDSMVQNYIVPFVRRYGNNPWLWSVDLCNEPDWIYENANCGRLPWSQLQVYFAKAAAAVHANSKVLVTVGLSMAAKYNSSSRGTNVLNDAALQAAAGGDVQARVDFYSSPHNYDWKERYWGNPFYMLPKAHGMDGTRPVVIGECSAKGSTGHSIVEDYESALTHGYQGVMGWTSNGVDNNGSLADLSPGTRAFRDAHWNLVFPGVPPPAPATK